MIWKRDNSSEKRIAICLSGVIVGITNQVMLFILRVILFRLHLIND